MTSLTTSFIYMKRNTLATSIILFHIAETLEWCIRNHMTLNTSKTKQMVISLRDDVHLTNPVKIGDDEIERVNTFRLLGVHIDEHLNFHHHVNDIVERSHTKYHALQLLKC